MSGRESYELCEKKFIGNIYFDGKVKLFEKKSYLTSVIWINKHVKMFEIDSFKKKFFSLQKNESQSKFKIIQDSINIDEVTILKVVQY